MTSPPRADWRLARGFGAELAQMTVVMGQLHDLAGRAAECGASPLHPNIERLGRPCWRSWYLDCGPASATARHWQGPVRRARAARSVPVIGLSVDATSRHQAWADDIEETQGTRPGYPIIGDTDLNVSKLYGMLPASASGEASSRCALDNLTVRNVFVISPDKKIKLIIAYPNVTGRNFGELLRVIDSLQLTTRHRVVTPANWSRATM